MAVGTIKATTDTIDSITVPFEVRQMAIDGGGGGDEVPVFSFAVRELQRADLSQSVVGPPTESKLTDWEIEGLANERPGFDPYNSTGGFDRSDGWSRIRKR